MRNFKEGLFQRWCRRGIVLPWAHGISKQFPRSKGGDETGEGDDYSLTW